MEQNNNRKPLTYLQNVIYVLSMDGMSQQQVGKELNMHVGNVNTAIQMIRKKGWPLDVRKQGRPPVAVPFVTSCIYCGERLGGYYISCPSCKKKLVNSPNVHLS